MDFTKITDTLQTAYRDGSMALYALITFGVIVLIGAVVTYLICCAKYKTTTLNGLVRVGVTLNEWPDTPPADAPARLVYGDVLISMHDPAAIREQRLDPALDWKQKASCREYEVVRLLERYCKTLENAGLHADAGVVLLRQMLSGNHCVGLGKICRPNLKKGLVVRASTEKKVDEKNSKRLMVYKKVPEQLAEDFCKATGCGVKNLCVTLEYLSQR